MPGQGTMTPISPGVPTGLSVAQPLPLTLLSLARYAKVMGVNPAHFWGASAPNLSPQIFPVIANCSAVWYQYAWQDVDRISRYDIAMEIANAEDDIARALGYWPAPKWVAEEEVPYPRPYRRELYGLGLNVRDQLKSVDLYWGKLIRVGARAVSLVGTATVIGGSLEYTDEDSDGFYETATVTLPTTLTNECELKLYQAGVDGAPEWEIRDPRSKSISGGFVTMVFDSWLFINPDLYEEMPSEDGAGVIDISTTANFVATVDVYREYVDTTEAAIQFMWEPSNTGCADADAECEDITQDGCARIRNAELGIIAPIPSSYDEDEGQWDTQVWSGAREPDRLNIYYQAGEVSAESKRGLTCDQMSEFWAKTIAWLATSRLERPPCSCGNSASLYERLSMDTMRSTPELTFFAPEQMHLNPFGTRVGEIAAWKRVQRLAKKRPRVALA